MARGKEDQGSQKGGPSSARRSFDVYWEKFAKEKITGIRRKEGGRFKIEKNRYSWGGTN